MFYHFSQNNSGGNFHFNEEKGITHHVIIEADNTSEANAIAEEIGIYFDGCSTGRDCECCGNRWYSACDWDKKDFPHVYGEEIKKALNTSHFYRWIEPGKEVCIHYKDGRKEWF